MKCPSCGTTLIFDQKKSRYICPSDSFSCDCDVSFLKEFGDFDADVAMELSDNRIYGMIYVGINMKNRTIIFQMDKNAPLNKKDTFVYGPISVNEIGVFILSFNEIGFEINNPLFPGFIAKSKNRDTTYYLKRLIETLKAN